MLKANNVPNLKFDINSTLLKGNFLWQIWIVKCTGNITTINFLYSWVLPSSFNKRGWQLIEISNLNSYKTIEGKILKVELLKTSFYGNGQEILTFIDGLIEGSTIVELVGTDPESLPPNEILNFMLGQSKTEILKSFLIRPEVFLPIEHPLIPWANKSIGNPTGYGSYVQQLFSMDKENITDFTKFKLTLEQSNSILKDVSAAFEKSTGFNIIRQSAPRIGNIEWYRFPFSDSYFKPFISYKVIKDEKSEASKKIEVRIKPNTTSEKDTILLIRCRVVNGEEVSLDEIREINWTNGEQILEFASKQPASEISVTVWEKARNVDTHRIVFEKNSVLMRSINFSISLIGTQINTGRINLLDKLSQKEAEKPKELAKFERSSKSNRSEVGGYKEDAWVAVGREAISFMKNNFPEKSESEFFINGWDSSRNESGQLSFVNWYLKLVSSNENGSLILIDPFFDKDGIELFAHTRTTNLSYRILTCTQHREKNEPQPNADIEPSAANAIRNYCKSALPLLNGLDMYIQDLRSIEGGKTQLVHDRYILITDEAGNVTKGFHLSNSLQGATRKAPLLITSIPSDVLPKVMDYIENILEVTEIASSKKTKLVQLFPFEEKEVNENLKKYRSTIFEIPNYKLALSVLLNDSDMLTMDQAEIQQYLDDKKLLEAPSSSLKLYKIIDSEIDAFAERLNTNSDFKNTWIPFCEVLAHSNYQDHESHYDAWKQLRKAIGKHSDLYLHFEEILKSFLNYTDTISHRDNLFGIFQSSSFEEGIEITLRHLMHFHNEGLSLPYYISYTCSICVSQFPDQTLIYLDSLVTEAKNGGWNQGNDVIKAKLLLISALATYFLSYSNRANTSLQQKILNSKNPIFRSIGTSALLYAYAHQDFYSLDKKTILETLRVTLPNDEFLYSIAKLISFSNMGKESEIENLETDEHFELLVNNTPLDENIIKSIVKILNGPLANNYSYTITNSFLLPLEDKHIIRKNFSFDYWQVLFLDKLSFSNLGKKDSDFSINTDVEFTNSIFHLTLQLDDENQANAISQWIDVLAPCWNPIIQPFAYLSNFHQFDRCIQNIFWISFILESLIATDKLTEKNKLHAQKFLDDHTQEINFVKTYLQKKKVQGVQSLELTMEKDATTDI